MVSVLDDFFSNNTLRCNLFKQGASQACKDKSSHAQLAYVYNEMENWFLKGKQTNRLNS